MKFSGHETFTVREGWLHKGMSLLERQPELFRDVIAASDAMGVGTNMVKSIRHWLVATGLAEVSGGADSILRATSFGKLVWKSDCYFTDIGTWWLLHIHLVRNQGQATTWYWFFNHFSHQRFDRTLCLNQLGHYLTYETSRKTSATTLNRDLSCLLASYARPIPEQHADPEDYTDCPFTELGLMNFYRFSNSYEMHLTPKPVPAEIVCYCMAREFHKQAQSGVTIRDATTAIMGPGRAFLLTSEALYDLMAETEQQLQGQGLQVRARGGERIVTLQDRPTEAWVTAYYEQRTLKTRKRDSIAVETR